MSKKCIFLIIAESAQIFESGNGPEMQKLDKCTCLCRFSWFSVIYIESRDSAFVRPNEPLLAVSTDGIGHGLKKMDLKPRKLTQTFSTVQFQ